MDPEDATTSATEEGAGEEVVEDSLASLKPIGESTDADGR